MSWAERFEVLPVLGRIFFLVQLVRADARPLTPSTSSVPLLSGARASSIVFPSHLVLSSLDRHIARSKHARHNVLDRHGELQRPPRWPTGPVLRPGSARLCGPVCLPTVRAEADPPSPAFASAPGEETYHGLELCTRAFTPGRDTMDARERWCVGPQCPQRSEDKAGRATRREEQSYVRRGCRCGPGARMWVNRGERSWTGSVVEI